MLHCSKQNSWNSIWRWHFQVQLNEELLNEAQSNDYSKIFLLNFLITTWNRGVKHILNVPYFKFTVNQTESGVSHAIYFNTQTRPIATCGKSLQIQSISTQCNIIYSAFHTTAYGEWWQLIYRVGLPMLSYFKGTVRRVVRFGSHIYRTRSKFSDLTFIYRIISSYSLILNPIIYNEHW